MKDETSVLSHYDNAAKRVHGTPCLAVHADFILYDWSEGEDHWDWVIEAPIAEILSWVKAGKELES